jgi:exodeoxyribonuclease VII small subunit
MAKKKEGFETQLEALESIVEELESGELSLDDSLARFEEGVKRLKECTRILGEAEAKVKVLVQDASGDLVEEDFEEA